MNKNYLMTIVLVIVFAAGGFYGGMKYQQSKVTPATPGAGRFARTGQNTNAMRPVAGDILSVDAQSITVKLADGSSKIVLLTGSTTFNKSDTATQADLKVGSTVSAFGTANSDGSVTASSVQLNPIRYNGANVGR